MEQVHWEDKLEMKHSFLESFELIFKITALENYCQVC